MSSWRNLHPLIPDIDIMANVRLILEAHNATTRQVRAATRGNRTAYENVRVVRRRVKLRVSRRKCAAVVATVEAGSVGYLIEKGGKWSLVECMDAESGEFRHGWVRSKYLSRLKEEAPRKRFLPHKLWTDPEQPAEPSEAQKEIISIDLPGTEAKQLQPRDEEFLDPLTNESAAVFRRREFTDEQLQAALRRVGEEARQAAFAAGRPVMVAKNGWLVLQHPDGREEIVGPVHPDRKVNTSG